MRTKDHLALGHFLLRETESALLNRYSRAFLIGCVEPDYDPANYVCGLVNHKRISRHNAEQSFACVEKLIGGFEQGGLRGALGCFKLGVMLHYVADAFTYPHNKFWEDGLAAHVIYERKLHAMFAGELEKRSGTIFPEAPLLPVLYFSGAHKEYSAAARSMQTDCEYIINGCAAMLLSSLRYAVPQEADSAKEILVYEGAYQHGLVQAGR